MKYVITFLLCLHSMFAVEVFANDTWKAKWISKSQTQSQTNTWLAFRKNVSIESVPETLIARMAADTKYWLWINGRLVVFEGGLKRGFSPSSTYYDEVDIAPYLKAGENQIAVLLWHFGRNGFSHINSGVAAFLFEAIAPGIEILSDRTWEASVHHAYQSTDAPHPNYRLPESNIRFDARLDFVGWNTGGYPKSLGSAMEFVVSPGNPPLGKLVKRPIPMWKDYGIREYVDVRQSGDTLFCRLPYNCQVTPYLKVDAPAGKIIKMQTDHYDIDKVLSVRAEYITRDGVQEYESLGWMNGHTVLYVVPDGVKVLEVKYRETGYNADFTGRFRCDDAFFNTFWEKAVRTLYVCMRDTYMDCPDRERAQWWGDEVNELGETFYALSPSAQLLATKGIYELMNWQRPDGAIYSPVPAANYANELPMQMLASVGWYGFYTHYFYSGDSTFVPVVYDRIHRYLHETWQVDADGLPIYRKGEWDWADGTGTPDPAPLQACWYYLALKGERAFAIQLGKTEDVAVIDRMMTRLKASFNKRYWNGSVYRSENYQKTADDRVQALAVLSGLASSEKYPALLEVLKGTYDASAYMEKYVLEALFQMGAPSVALDRMKERYPAVMKDSCSTLYEHWNFSGSANHAWTGAPIILFGQKICGIEPLEPGFRLFRVAPQMGYLKEVEGAVDTKFGLIEVKAQKKGRKIHLTLSVPEGAIAEVPVSKKEVKRFGAGTHTLSISR